MSSISITKFAHYQDSYRMLKSCSQFNQLRNYYLHKMQHNSLIANFIKPAKYNFGLKINYLLPQKKIMKIFKNQT